MLTTEVPIIYDIVDNLFALGANWASKLELLAQIPIVWTHKKHTSPGWNAGPVTAYPADHHLHPQQ